MKREEIELDKETVHEHLISSWEKGTDEYKHVLDTIHNVDEGDGGADRTLVIQRLSDNKFFSVNYTDWDMVDIEGTMIFTEAYAVEKTIISYE